MGALSMARLIRDRINRALADELLFGKLAQGGTVRVREEEGILLSTLTPTTSLKRLNTVLKSLIKRHQPKAVPESRHPLVRSSLMTATPILRVSCRRLSTGQAVLGDRKKKPPR